MREIQFAFFSLQWACNLMCHIGNIVAITATKNCKQCQNLLNKHACSRMSCVAFKPFPVHAGSPFRKSLLCCHQHGSPSSCSPPAIPSCGIYGILCLLIWSLPRAIFSCHTIQKGIDLRLLSIFGICLWKLQHGYVWASIVCKMPALLKYVWNAKDPSEDK